MNNLLPKSPSRLALECARLSMVRVGSRNQDV